jgi:hypothetical protein
LQFSFPALLQAIYRSASSNIWQPINL